MGRKSTALLLDGAQVGDELPALRFGEPGPGRHAMSEVALAKEPFEVTVGGGFYAGRAEARFFMSVAHRIVFVTLGAVVFVDQSTG